MNKPDLSPDAHARAALLIPWLVNGTLSEEGEAGLRAHLSVCPRCREDYESEMRLRTAMDADSSLVFVAESSYQKLLTRIDSGALIARSTANVRDTAAPRRIARRDRAPGSRGMRWLVAVAAFEAVALGLGAWLWPVRETPRPAPYRTLTSPAPSYESALQARVVFRSDFTLGQLRTLLRGIHAHIIDGPAPGNVYTLGFAPLRGSPREVRQTISALRASPAVLFAEPLARRAAP